MCRNAWIVLHGTSKQRVADLLQAGVADATGAISRASYGARYETGPAEDARVWLAEYFSEENGRCERQPNPTGGREIWHLPAWACYTQVYYAYKDSRLAESSRPASFTVFWRVWNELFSHIKTPATNRFSKCALCVTLKNRIASGGHSAALVAARADQKRHWERVTTERQFLADAINTAKYNPDKLFLFEIDGMDSSKTLLPHYCQRSKDVNPELLIKYHVTCVKHVDGRPDDVYLYTNVLPHDASNTCTVIWRTLLKVNATSAKGGQERTFVRHCLAACGLDEY